MKSSRKISIAHLATVRQRRMKRVRRQRAIEVGKPVDVSLKPMALNSAEQKELSNLHVRPQDVRKHGIMTPKRVSMMAAVGLHLIAVLLAAHYIVWPTRLDAKATTVEFVHSASEHPRRARQSICDIGRSIFRHDGCLTPNSIPRGLNGRIRGFGPTRPDAFVTLETQRLPIFRKRIEPEYPKEAKRAGKEGMVVLEATIDVNGKAKDIKVKEDTVGFGCARAAIEALKASRFIPTKRGGKSISQRMTVPYVFKLEDSLNPFEEAGCLIPESIHRDGPNSLEITRPPAFRTKIEPKYPRAALHALKEGNVVLQATIDVDGKAKDIKIKEDTVGFGCARAAIQALEASRFIPAKRGGESIHQRITVPYVFKLEDSPDPSEQAGCSAPSPDPIHRDGPSSLEITRPPAFRTKIEPKHPRAARLAQKEGKVVLIATIDLEGRPKDIKVKEDNVGFGCARAAIDALEASLFRPAKRGVESVPIRIAIPYLFRLGDEVTRVNQESPRTPVESNLEKKIEDGC